MNIFVTDQSEEPLKSGSHHESRAGELRNLLREIIHAQQDTNHHLKRIEKQMADINVALADLQASVTTAVAELGGGVADLQERLAQAQSDLAALQVQDDADKAALAESLQATSDAADQIEGQVAALNAATSTVTPPAPETPPAS